MSMVWREGEPVSVTNKIKARISSGVPFALNLIIHKKSFWTPRIFESRKINNELSKRLKITAKKEEHLLLFFYAFGQVLYK